MGEEQAVNSREAMEFEYSTIMDSYHNYFAVVAKGISIYLLIIGACLSLPYTLKFNTTDQVILFKEMCRTFAVTVSVAGVAGYLVASGYFFGMHKRAKRLASDLKLHEPPTLLMPVIIWLASAVAVILVFMITRYT